MNEIKKDLNTPEIRHGIAYFYFPDHDETRSITMNFGDLKVLKGIDVSIRKGEIVTLVGPSGAGKTTFLHIMGTLLNRPPENRH